MINKQKSNEDIMLFRNWCVIFLEYMIGREKKEGKNDYSQYSELIDIVDRESDKGNLRGLRALVSDFLEWHSYFPEVEKREINTMLKEKLGNNYLTINTFRDKIVKRVLKTKQILSDDDYYAVSSYVHDSDMQLKYPEKVNKLELIMSNYQSEELRNQQSA